MLSVAQNRIIVRASAAYDLIVTWPFMTPPTFHWNMTAIASLASSIGLTQGFPPFDAVHVLFANLMASLVVVWSVLRWRSPTRQLGLYDASARALFAIWQLVAVAGGANPIILAFTAVELLFLILQVLPVAPAADQRRQTIRPQ